jgi:calcium/calmodulin-dependent protein kinase (CaM kinase) II
MNETEVIELTRRLLHAITHGDWKTYTELCAADLTAFEPEALGQLVQGMDFHQHYFDLAGPPPAHGPTTTICSPHVRLMGDAALIAYVRLTQRVGADGQSRTTATQETRLWQRIGGQWKHVHFHRS